MLLIGLTVPFQIVLAKGGKLLITKETFIEMENHRSQCSSSLGWTFKTIDYSKACRFQQERDVPFLPPLFVFPLV